MFIKALASISPQPGFGANELPDQPIVYDTNRLACIEPDYKDWVDPKMIRRMSRIIKMGVAAAMKCLKDAGIEAPDAIVTGTAYGCLEDTGVFLNRMIEFKEEMLNPTSFIQSTHNTVGAQIALSVKCYGYNNTFVHRGFSFESAMLDGILLLKDREVNNVLVGAVDEITNISFSILNRFAIYRKGGVSTASLFEPGMKGTVAGEGAAFFLLTDEPAADNCAALDAIHTFYKPGSQQKVVDEIQAFLAAQSLNASEIDLFITGMNGDAENDEIYHFLGEGLLAATPTSPYKQLCGEYPTSSAFALWMAATSIRKSGQSKKVLIYNHYKHIHHSLFLLSSC
jgi:3-oxoacyl-[acyl-carrier-protein] synthase II